MWIKPWGLSCSRQKLSYCFFVFWFFWFGFFFFEIDCYQVSQTGLELLALASGVLSFRYITKPSLFFVLRPVFSNFVIFL